MFESALQSIRPRRRASVLLSTSIHAALCGALVLPPMLRMPELAEDPPDNLPKFVDIFRDPRRDDTPRRLPPQTPPHAVSPATKHGGGGPPPDVRVVAPPTVIGELPKPLPEGTRDDTYERAGALPFESSKTGGGGAGDAESGPPGDGTNPIPANAVGVTPPVPLSTPAPVYPEVLRMAHIEGTVILEAVIDRGGLVRDVRLLRGANPLLDRAATEAVLRWHYAAARIDDHAVAVYLTVTVSFRISH